MPDDLDGCAVLLDLSGRLPDAYAAGVAGGIWQVSVFGDREAEARAAVLRGALAVPCELTCIPSPGVPPGQIAHCLVQPKLTLRRSLGFVQAKAAQMLLHWLARFGMAGELPALAPVEPRVSGATFLDRAAYVGRIVKEGVQRLSHRVRERSGGTPQPFSMRFGPGEIETFDPSALSDIPNPPGCYRADPYLFEDSGTLYCFHEVLDYRRGKGHIEVGRIDGTAYTPIGPALKQPYHLSFPHVFRHGDDIYMLPEAGESRRVEIWKCTKFPLEWRLHATALDGEAAGDPVLFQDRDRWWLFVNLSNDDIGDLSSELHLFSTDGPDLGAITPHPLNPVVVGSDTARGAGRIFTLGDRLVRPAQDNLGRTYGRGLSLMEITTLTEDDYAERRIRHLLPDFEPGIIGCHHIDSCDGRIIIDIRHP